MTVHRCEICGRPRGKNELYSDMRNDGRKKNKGECNECAHEGEALVKAAIEHADPYLIDAIKEEARPGNLNLEDKIALARSCGNFYPDRALFGNCSKSGYAPFDCEGCTSYHDREATTEGGVDSGK